MITCQELFASAVELELVPEASYLALLYSPVPLVVAVLMVCSCSFFVSPI
ncbi:MAG TPA: hypothetical protein VLE89_00705 [Chlamydiales bacterium]|nr:hypothetical protein [Chlamydiales bacterium]